MSPHARSIRFLGLIALLLGALTLPTLAHEGREAGEYNLVFGWRVEPAYAGMANGPEVILEKAGDADADVAEADMHAEGAMFDGMEVELSFEVTFGDQTMTAPFRQAWMQPGHFIADLVPTLPGDYTFRVFGTIGEVEVDQTFSSADGQFSSVEPSADIMFPSVGGMEARIADLEARLAALEAQMGE